MPPSLFRCIYTSHYFLLLHLPFFSLVTSVFFSPSFCLCSPADNSYSSKEKKETNTKGTVASLDLSLFLRSSLHLPIPRFPSLLLETSRLFSLLCSLHQLRDQQNCCEIYTTRNKSKDQTERRGQWKVGRASRHTHSLSIHASNIHPPHKRRRGY